MDLIILCAIAIIPLAAGDGFVFTAHHDSQPPFRVFRHRLYCFESNQTIRWDNISIETVQADCGIVLLHQQFVEITNALDRCLNDHNINEHDCISKDTGLMYKFDTSILHPPACLSNESAPVTSYVLNINIIYHCEDGIRFHSAEELGDILTMPPSTPPKTARPPPPLPPPSMAVGPPEESHITPRHNVVSDGILLTPEVLTSTEMLSTKISIKSTDYSSTVSKNASAAAFTVKPTILEITASVLLTSTTKPNQKPAQETKTLTNQSQNSPDSTDQQPTQHKDLPLIIGCSIGGAAVIAIIIAVIVLIKRRQIKLPMDLQAESLFNSRRFSTASVLSDISLNAHVQPLPVVA